MCIGTDIKFNNYRNISVLLHASKILLGIMKERTENKILMSGEKPERWLDKKQNSYFYLENAFDLVNMELLFDYSIWTKIEIPVSRKEVIYQSICKQ